MRDEQGKRLYIASVRKCAEVHRVKACVTDQLSGRLFCSSTAAAVKKVRTGFPPAPRPDRVQQLTGYRAEGRYHLRAGDLASQNLGSRAGMTDDQTTVVRAHRQCAAQQRLSGQPARLGEYVIHLTPVHGEQQRVSVNGSFRRSSRACVASGFGGQSLQFPAAARVAEGNLVAGPRKDASELGAYQSGAKNTDSHACSNADGRIGGKPK